MIYITGSFPEPLYKFYGKEQYARDFIERGLIRMSPLQYYTNIEDGKRQDPREGAAEWKSHEKDMLTLHLDTDRITSGPGEMTHHLGELNLKRVFCMSGPDVDHAVISKKFDPYVVEIFKPELFVEDVHQNLLKTPSPGLTPFRLDRASVVYDKGLVTAGTKTEDMVDMVYRQKEPRYAEEREHRLVISYAELSEDESHLELRLSRVNEYARLYKK